MNTSPKDSKHDNFRLTQPIPIGRRRSASVSSSSSGSQSSAEPVTPLSANAPRIPTSPSSSPILSYFLAQSPAKNGTFPFTRNFGPSVFEEKEPETEIPVAAHARRASTTVSSRFGQQQPTPILPEAHRERGTAVLRRLSLSSGFVKPPVNSQTRIPSPPPNTAVSPSAAKTLPETPSRKPKRSATLSPDAGRPRRAPSPMGERILKGHFDGFN